jgi:CheY-like chemotaxis protein
MKQNGVCRYCNKKFSEEDQIVSNGKRRKYYHRECADKLNIVVLLSKGNNDDKLKVLIVDDEPDILKVYRMFLEKYGFKVEAYSDPQSALVNYKPGDYDLLLLDIRMPTMTGFELYNAILGKEGENKPKVCFITAYSDLAEEAKKFVPELSDEFIVRKPVTLDSLYKRLSALLK